METPKENIEIAEVMVKLHDLKKEIEAEVVAIGNDKVNVFEHLKKRSLESKLQRLTRIKEILSIDRYKLVFVGSVGAGKTTAICHLFNLIGKFNRQEEINKRKVTIEKTEALFSTASGRTTICEVIVTASEKTYIEIEPYSRESLEGMINDFCESFYQKDYSEGESISPEVDRAIRSIVDLRKSKVKDSTGKEKMIDPAKEKASTTPVEQLKTLALQNANLDARIFNREESKLFCPAEKEERAWLKTNFDRINRGEEESFSIPRKIYVYVSSNILKGSELPIFDCVVDTKGIDENPIRPDLRDYIEREDSICVFTTRYNDAPEANIRELFKYFLSQRSKKYEQRFVVFVNPRKGEPEKENDGDNTWETGVSIKKDIVVDALKNLNLTFIPDNVLFFDALKCYDDKYRLMQDYTEQDTLENINDVLFGIKNIIQNRKKVLVDEVAEIHQSFLSVVNGQALTEDDIKVINNTVAEIKLLSNLGLRIQGFVYDEFIDKYIEYYSKRYPAWNTKDAIHRRYGTYDLKGYDTYYDAKVVSEGTDEDEMVRKFTRGIKDEIITTIEKLGNTHPDLDTFAPEIIKRFETDYDQFVNKVGDAIQNYFSQHNSNIDFWANLINRRGKGKGYNDDVCTMLRRNLDSIRTGHGNNVSASRLLQEYTETHWREAIAQVLNFFVAS